MPGDQPPNARDEAMGLGEHDDDSRDGEHADETPETGTLLLGRPERTLEEGHPRHRVVPLDDSAWRDLKALLSDAVLPRPLTVDVQVVDPGPDG